MTPPPVEVQAARTSNFAVIFVGLLTAAVSITGVIVSGVFATNAAKASVRETAKTERQSILRTQRESGASRFLTDAAAYTDQIEGFEGALRKPGTRLTAAQLTSNEQALGKKSSALKSDIIGLELVAGPATVAGGAKSQGELEDLRQLLAEAVTRYRAGAVPFTAQQLKAYNDQAAVSSQAVRGFVAAARSDLIAD